MKRQSLTLVEEICGPGDRGRLRRKINEFARRFRAAGKVTSEDEATAMHLAVYSYLLNVAYGKLSRTLPPIDAEDHAAAIACRVSQRVLSETHFHQWVFTPNDAQPSTYVYQCVRNAIVDVFRSLGKKSAVSFISIDAPSTQAKDVDGEDAPSLQLVTSDLDQEQELILKREFTPEQLELLRGSAKLHEIAAETGKGKSTVHRMATDCRARAREIFRR